MPLFDGYRWEDAFGRFSTAKFSASPEAAIGRTLARYRRRTVDGVSILDKMKGFLIGPPSPGGPTLRENSIPDSYFEDAHLLYLEYDEQFRFIDLEHQRTRDTLREALSGPLENMGKDLADGLSQQRDRRLTRLVTATLHDTCAKHTAGIRYRARDKHWDAYVFWDNPARIDLTQATSVAPIFPEDEALLAAVATLGLSLPTGRES